MILDNLQDVKGFKYICHTERKIKYGFGDMSCYIVAFEKCHKIGVLNKIIYNNFPAQISVYGVATLKILVYLGTLT